MAESSREYLCPNGHVFRWPQAIKCAECEASVVMVPTAEVYELRDEVLHLRMDRDGWKATAEAYAIALGKRERGE